MRFFLINIAIVSTTLCAFGQDDCRSLLLAAVHEMRQMPEGKGIHLAYHIKTTYAQTNKVSTNRLEIKAIGKQVHLSSDKTQMYQNRQVMISIFEERKIVYLTNATDMDLRKLQFGNIGIIQDSIMSKAPIALCQEVCVSEIENKNLKQLKIDIPINMQSYLGMKNVTYWIDSKKQKIERITAEMVDGGEVSSIDMEIMKMDKTYDGPVFRSNHITQMLNNPDNIKSLYKGYQIIDQRNSGNQ